MMTTANKPALRAWLKAHSACVEARDWVAAHPIPTIENCPVGEWFLWLAPLLGYSQAEQDAAVRPTRLRALRVYTPAALDVAGLHDHAAQLRALPDDVDMVHAAEVAETARLAAWQAAWQVAEAAAASTEATALEAPEAARNAVWAAKAARAAWAAATLEAAEAPEAARNAAWAAWAVAAEAAEAEAAEYALCAQEVRAAFPDLQQRLDAALEAM